jgi:hypothetical protein
MPVFEDFVVVPLGVFNVEEEIIFHDGFNVFAGVDFSEDFGLFEPIYLYTMEKKYFTVELHTDERPWYHT